MYCVAHMYCCQGQRLVCNLGHVSRDRQLAMAHVGERGERERDGERGRRERGREGGEGGGGGGREGRERDGERGRRERGREGEERERGLASRYEIRLNSPLTTTSLTGPEPQLLASDQSASFL